MVHPGPLTSDLALTSECLLCGLETAPRGSPSPLMWTQPLAPLEGLGVCLVSADDGEHRPCLWWKGRDPSGRILRSMLEGLLLESRYHVCSPEPGRREPEALSSPCVAGQPPGRVTAPVLLGPLCQKVGSLHGMLSPAVAAPVRTTGWELGAASRTTRHPSRGGGT